ncbi:Cysteine-rich receptor-like protein kinase 42 [Morella rubra]|uniref:Cysteine-rich receptor-like protein kinase 42 n=1 Tax=Morella rubra TaxID=262757 RepID=A0A6A1VFZ3_9ROSI|nr:Cysteine-rich receptor-like protein kinase 42 [Morella rubra]
MNVPRNMQYGGLSLTMVLTCWLWLRLGVVADPQTKYLLNGGCTTSFNASKVQHFHTNLNAAFSDLEDQLRRNKHFAKARVARGSVPAYAMVQCRNYLSNADCIACFKAAESQIISNCSTAGGAQVIYDSCFLRYETSNFYPQTTLPGSDKAICQKQMASQARSLLLNFTAAVGGLLADLKVATPRIKGFFGASKEGVLAGRGGHVYAVAQCVETATENGCQKCLKKAYKKARRCLPGKRVRAVDAGCFLRYSDTASFFADNQITMIDHYLRNGPATKKKAIIQGVVGGVPVLLLIALIFKLTRRPKAALRGDILGTAELRGPMNYKYKDLKSATRISVKKTNLAKETEQWVAAALIRYPLHPPLTARGLAYLHEEFHAWNQYENGTLLELVDETLDPKDYTAEEAKRIIEIALMCTQSFASLRPPMSEVVLLLKSNEGSLEHPPPTKPAYVASYS